MSFRHYLEGVAEQDNGSDRAGGCATAFHCDAQVRLLQREHVVHAVADHRHIFSLAAKGIDQRPLLLRGNSPEHGRFDGCRGELGQAHGVEFGAGDGAEITWEPGTPRQCGDGLRIVAGDDLELDPIVDKR